MAKAPNPLSIPQVEQDRAGVLIGEAMSEYAKVKRDTATLLAYGIDCGSKLLEAKAIFKNEDKSWVKKLKASWTCASTRTAYRYMALAEHSAEVRKEFDTVSNDKTKEWTLREAIEYAEELQRKAKDQLLSDTERAEKNKKREDNKARKAPAKSGTPAPDLTAMIKAEPAADVLAKAISDAGMDEEAKHQLACNLLGGEAETFKRLLNGADEDEIIGAIERQSWKTKDLIDLAKRLVALADEWEGGQPSFEAIIEDARTGGTRAAAIQ